MDPSTLVDPKRRCKHSSDSGTLVHDSGCSNCTHPWPYELVDNTQISCHDDPSDRSDYYRQECILGPCMALGLHHARSKNYPANYAAYCSSELQCPVFMGFAS